MVFLVGEFRKTDFVPDDEYNEKKNEEKSIGERMRLWEPKIDILNKNAEGLVTRVMKSFERYGKRKLALLPYVTENLYPDPIVLGLHTNEMQLAFAIQAYMYNRTDGQTNFTDPYDPKEAKRYLKELFVNNVHKERARIKKELDEKYKITDIKLKVWAQTTDIYAAAGALLGTAISKNITQYAKCLQEARCPLGVEKIKMLIYGKHKNKTLVIDVDKMPKKFWIPSKANCYKFWKIYHEDMEPADWAELFGKVEANHNIDVWYSFLTENKWLPVNVERFDVYIKGKNIGRNIGINTGTDLPGFLHRWDSEYL